MYLIQDGYGTTYGSGNGNNGLGATISEHWNRPGTGTTCARARAVSVRRVTVEVGARRQDGTTLRMRLSHEDHTHDSGSTVEDFDVDESPQAIAYAGRIAIPSMYFSAAAPSQSWLRADYHPSELRSISERDGFQLSDGARDRIRILAGGGKQLMMRTCVSFAESNDAATTCERCSPGACERSDNADMLRVYGQNPCARYEDKQIHCGMYDIEIADSCPARSPATAYDPGLVLHCDLD
jgi:hypothetical protein